MMSRPFGSLLARRRESREFEVEMARFYGNMPGDMQGQLRSLHEREAGTPGTLAYRNELERTRPWRVLASVLLLVVIVAVVVAACGGSLADLGGLILQPFGISQHG